MKKIKYFLLIVFGLIALAYAGVFGYHYYHYRVAYSINEPVWLGPKVQYCRLVFGPEGRVRMLVRRNGDGIAIDADENGSFGWSERFSNAKDCKGIVIADPDGETSYRITEVQLVRSNKEPWSKCQITLEIQRPLNYTQAGNVDMSEQSEGAPEIHFNSGSLSFYDAPDPCLLGRILQKEGDKNYRLCLTVTLGTSNVCVPGIVNGKRTFPKGVCPVAEIEFPPGNPGDPPIKKQYALDEFC